MSDSPTTTRELIDPYLDWSAAEGVPVHEGYGVNLLQVETKPWARFGLDGAIVHLKARGDFVTLYVHELKPGGASAPVRHMYEQLVYVLSGHGSTQLEGDDGRKITFEWGPHSLFAIPLNATYRMFNGSGREPARYISVNTLPVMLNLFRDKSFIFGSGHDFKRIDDLGVVVGDIVAAG